MTNLNNFCKEDNRHYLNCVYAFITADEMKEKHLYVAGEDNTVIDLSSESHEEYKCYDTVEELTNDKDETILKIYTDFDKFCIMIADN